jgi:hypothetical protein
MSIITNTVHGPRKLTKHDIMGIRYIEEPIVPEGGAPVGTPPVEPESPKPGPPAAADTVEGSADGGKTFTSDYVEKLRKEAAKNRVDDKAAIQAQIDTALTNGQKAWATELAKKLGVIEDEGEATPEDIIKTLTTERDDFRTKFETLSSRDIARNERDAINTASATYGGDDALVRAVIKADDLLTGIDPNADDYAAQVAAVVKEQIEKNTKLLKVQVAPRSGSETPPSGGVTDDPEDVDSFRKKYRTARGFADK